VRLILDTHTFLWFIDGDPRLSANAKQLIEDMNNDRFLGMASPWEMAIKVSQKKLSLALPVEILIPLQLSRNAITLLDINLSHVAMVASMPLHHRDPFDRILIAQSQVEQMPIISRDTALDAYGVTRLW
jgi:PIN domain nuclease of toxin-antitoxin system